jgi:hypothetical protein
MLRNGGGNGRLGECFELNEFEKLSRVFHEKLLENSARFEGFVGWRS